MMATADQVARLRRMVGTTTLADEELGERIDVAGGDLDAAAADVWEEKAATAAAYVDVKEGASTRSLGSLYQNATDMARFYRSGGTSSSPAGVARTRPAVREGGF